MASLQERQKKHNEKKCLQNLGETSGATTGENASSAMSVISATSDDTKSSESQSMEEGVPDSESPSWSKRKNAAGQTENETESLAKVLKKPTSAPKKKSTRERKEGGKKFNPKTFSEYVDAVRNTTKWATSVELAAACDAFDIKLVVHDKRNDEKNVTEYTPNDNNGEDNDRRTVHLLYDGVHYNLVSKIVPGDGNCFYTCLKNALEFGSQSDVRRRVADELANNRLSEFIPRWCDRIRAYHSYTHWPKNKKFQPEHVKLCTKKVVCLVDSEEDSDENQTVKRIVLKKPTPASKSTRKINENKRSNPLQTAGPAKAFLKAASADAEESASADDESSSAGAGDATEAVAGAGAAGAGTAPAAAASAGGAGAPGGDNDPSTDLSHKNGKKRTAASADASADEESSAMHSTNDSKQKAPKKERKRSQVVRPRVPQEFHKRVATKLNARVEDLQFQFPVTAALQQINVNAENFNEAFGWFKVLESISDEDKVRIFANVVVPKQKTKKRHKPSRETFLKRIKFVQAVMGAVKAAQHDGDLTATSNDSDPSNNMGLEARAAAQHNGDLTATSNDSDPSNNMCIEARVAAQHNVHAEAASASASATDNNNNNNTTKKKEEMKKTKPNIPNKDPQSIAVAAIADAKQGLLDAIYTAEQTLDSAPLSACLKKHTFQSDSLLRQSCGDLVTTAEKLSEHLRPKFHVIFIGTDKWTADADKMAELFIKVLKYPRKRVHVLNKGKGPAPHEVIDKISQLSQEVGPNDTFIYYHSGHGIYKNGVKFVINEKHLSRKQLVDAVDNLGAKQVIYIIDTCYSGRFNDFDAKFVTDFPNFPNDNQGNLIIAAASANQIAPESSDFSRMFMEICHEIIAEQKFLIKKNLPNERTYMCVSPLGIISRIWSLVNISGKYAGVPHPIFSIDAVGHHPIGPLIEV